MEPFIRYTAPKKFRRQSGPECASNAMATHLEKMFEVRKGLIVKFNADVLDNEVRAHYQMQEVGGISLENVTDYIKDHGIYDELSKARLYVNGIHRVRKSELKIVLHEMPLLLVINSVSRTIPSNRIAKITNYNKDPKKTHALNIFEYEAKGWGIIDSNCTYLYYYSETDLSQIFRAAYYVIL